jgi:hypothetical protein
VYLSRFDHEVNVVVGNKGTEFLGNSL